MFEVAAGSTVNTGYGLCVGAIAALTDPSRIKMASSAKVK